MYYIIEKKILKDAQNRDDIYKVYKELLIKILVMVKDNYIV